MDMLVRKLEVHAGSSDEAAKHAFDEALVCARDAAHGSVYSKLLHTCGRSFAMQVSEDIAQSVALHLFGEKVRERFTTYLPALKTEISRRKFFGKVISYACSTAMRANMRGPKFVSLYCSDEDGSWKLADPVNNLPHSSLPPSDLVTMLDSVRGLIDELAVQWRSTKSSQAVLDWSPAREIVGLADESDRPSTLLLAKRTRERRQEEAFDITRMWRQRSHEYDLCI